MKVFILFILLSIASCRSHYSEEKVHEFSRIDDKYLVGKGMDRKEVCLFIRALWNFPKEDSIPNIPRYDPCYCLIRSPNKYLKIGDSVIYVWGDREWCKLVFYNSFDYRKTKSKLTYYGSGHEMETSNKIDSLDSNIVMIPKFQ